MRGLSSNRFAAVAVVAVIAGGCASSGPKTGTAAEDPQAPVSDIALLEVSRQITLASPGSPLGRRLRLAAMPAGDWYLLDTDHNRILHYDQAGNLEREVGGLGTGPLEFDGPVDFDTDGLSLWVLDRQNRRVLRLDVNLNFIEEMAVGAAADDPTGTIWYDALAVSPSGDLLLLDRREPRVVRLSPGGELLATYGGFGLGTGRLEQPTDLAVAQNGDVYVADGARVQIYDRAGNFRGAVNAAKTVTALAGNLDGAWGILAGGDLANFVRGRTQRAVVDPARGRPEPVAIALVRGQGPAILAAGLSVWQFAPFGR
jgi:hypothetical protein